MADSDIAGQASDFPTNPEDFDSDERISFSKQLGRFILVRDDGVEFEFVETAKKWILSIDEDLMEQQRKAYAVEGVDPEETVEDLRKKRKKQYVNGEDVSSRSLTMSNSDCVM